MFGQLSESHCVFGSHPSHLDQVDGLFEEKIWIRHLGWFRPSTRVSALCPLLLVVCLSGLWWGRVKKGGEEKGEGM